MTDEIDPEDVMTPAQKIYAMSVVEAERTYRAAVAAARESRDRAVSDALATCMAVMRMEADHGV